MKHAIALFFLVIFISLEPADAGDIQTSPVQTGSITVQLTGAENDKGTVKLCVCRSEDEYTGNKKEFCTAAAEIKSKKAEWVFKNMPYGTYSIKAFHDENENSKLDTNFAGMPVELYGFSNNARGRFGPPSFTSTAFTLNAPQMTVTINLK